MRMIIDCRLCKRKHEYKYRGGAPRVLCPSCAKEKRRGAWRKASEERRKAKGSLMGVGSGGNQWGTKNHRWKDGRRSYRRLALDIHGRKCFICGRDSMLQVHHTDRDRLENNKVNLLPLCLDCHRAAHVFYELG
jgi:hypothetical protein